jgi:hypothetical protein
MSPTSSLLQRALSMSVQCSGALGSLVFGSFIPAAVLILFISFKGSRILQDVHGINPVAVLLAMG